MTWTLHDLNISYEISSLSVIAMEMKFPEHVWKRTFKSAASNTLKVDNQEAVHERDQEVARNETQRVIVPRNNRIYIVK